MYNYDVWQWLLFFYIYCFIGWCWETVYVSIKEKKLVNRGFLKGPFLPIYGSGAIILLMVVIPFRGNIVLTYIVGMIAATVLELATGILMEAMFKVRYWDYSNQKFNYKGYICLTSSIAWGFFTIILEDYIHKPISKLVLESPINAISYISIALTIYMIIDFVISFHGALNLRMLLHKMEKAKDELVTLARSTGQLQEGITEYGKLKISELEKMVKEKLEELSKVRPEEKQQGQVEREKEYKDRLQTIMDKHNLHVKKRKKQNSRITGNPTMVSKRYKGTLDDLKQMLKEERNIKKKNK